MHRYLLFEAIQNVQMLINFVLAPLQSTQGSSIAAIEPLNTLNGDKPVDENLPKRLEKPCPKSKKRFYAEEGSVGLQLNRPESTAVPIQDVEGAMAELFAGTETPDMILQRTENNGKYCG